MSKQNDSKQVSDLLKQMEDSTGRIIVDFTGSYCPPCKQLEPILAELANEFRDGLEVVTLDIEEHPEVAQRYNVRSVPTLLAFHNGQVVSQQIGFSNVRRVREMFEELVSLD